ncbi:MAG: hypothetical protein WD645_05820 [Dehalococcoidia bacterium]
MSMYTAFRAEIPVNKLGLTLIGELEKADNASDLTHWEQALLAAPELEVLRPYLANGRHNMIPRGAGGQVPRAWSVGGDDNVRYVSHGAWHILCTLKNYDQTIERFMQQVIPCIVDPSQVHRCVVYTWHETPRRVQEWRWRSMRMGLVRTDKEETH